MTWTTPITDRTALDITNRTAKGFFNVVDWIRINGNAEIVSALVSVMRFMDIEFETLTEPTITTIPTNEDINAFTANIERARAIAGLPVVLDGGAAIKTDWLPGPGVSSPDYETVNHWEKCLEMLHAFVATASDYLVWCGVAEVGQARFWQSRFRMWPYYAQPDAPNVRRARAGIALAGSGLNRQNKWRHYT